MTTTWNPEAITALVHKAWTEGFEVARYEIESDPKGWAIALGAWDTMDAEAPTAPTISTEVIPTTNVPAQTATTQTAPTTTQQQNRPTRTIINTAKRHYTNDHGRSSRSPRPLHNERRRTTRRGPSP